MFEGILAFLARNPNYSSSNQALLVQNEAQQRSGFN
jgi:hypothetical protein